MQTIIYLSIFTMLSFIAFILQFNWKNLIFSLMMIFYDMQDYNNTAS